MNIKIYEFSDYIVEVIPDPSDNLSIALQDELVAECTELSREGFSNPHITEAFVRYCVLSSSTIVCARDYEGQLMGYSSNSLEIIGGYYIIYLQATAMLTKCQGKGMRNSLFPIKVLEDMKKLKNIGVETRHILLATRTQSPLIFKSAVRDLGLFPQPGRAVDPQIQYIGKELVSCLYNQGDVENNKKNIFDETYFIVREAYKPITQTGKNGVYPLGIPYCQDDDEINQYMDKHINWMNGDALFLLGYFNEEIIRRMYEDMKKRADFFGVYESVLDHSAPVAYL